MRANLPNLELLEFKASLLLKKDEKIVEKIKKYWKDRGYKCFENTLSFEFDVEMFPQTWGSTCTAFDVTKDGQATMGGSAITKAYTTVFYEPISEAYFVFVGGEFCYLVTNATKTFLSDLKKKNLKSLSEAKKFY